MFAIFTVACIVSSISACGILLLKFMFHRQLTTKWNYYLWFLLLAALVIPFIPSSLLSSGTFFNEFGGALSANHSDEAAQEPLYVSSNANLLQDFTVSVGRFAPDLFQTVVICIWASGILILAFVFFISWINIRRVTTLSERVVNREILNILEHCKRKLYLTNELRILESPLVQSPLLTGFFKPCLVFPSGFTEWLTEAEVKHIILHELHHLRSKDYLTNYLFVVFQMLYWFNPLIWLAFRKMRLDREIACDQAVLKLLDEEQHAGYGLTILHFAERGSKSSYLNLANQLVSPKSQLKQRIEKIANFAAESRSKQRISITIVIFTVVFILCQLPLVSAVEYDDSRYSFKEAEPVYEDLSRYFSGYEGTFVLYDMQQDEYQIYNKDHSTRRVSPDSTYKIYSALIGLETKAISEQDTRIAWNGHKYPYTEWNRDQTMHTALQDSVNWYFENMESRINRSEIQHYLNLIQYGNTDISGNSEPYWLESSLKISAVEQVKLLHAMYTNQLGFDRKHAQAVQKAIHIEDKGDRALFGKTGTGTVNQKNTNGWFIGYVEDEDNCYFFATNIQDHGRSNGSTAAQITLQILEDKGIY